MMPIILLTIVSIILNKLGLILVPNLLKEGDLITENYKGQQIPVGYGLLFGLNMLIILVMGSLLGYYPIFQVQSLISLILVMSFVGILDDTIGRKDNQGFGGHFKALLVKGKLTTGTIKAIFSCFIVFFINFYSYDDWNNVIINTLVILLTTNFINLLDLRPGRALKVTLIFLITILLTNPNDYLLVIPMVITVLFSLPFDLNAGGMMGDVGANVLGVIIGFLLISSFDLYLRIIIMFLLILIHLYTENYSLSTLIKNNKVLNYFDQLGRTN
ncbi:Glycosyl transferase family 4 [Halobacteroides halobius DSM 5150]|uniref:Glycosyl transferase family 4 n=1 Tax=Halobacteroides halobius (strain ATCC 35273 / DSM 5150 / MD-1) TaxID=748449 RepID=L0K695_HALHC|nr:glycosyl transferase family 4 [Halobacteroides halobius]AGB40546.1 Glycosyl transferase family 4 [Halobacteroides halobius DSM 5150]